MSGITAVRDTRAPAHAVDDDFAELYRTRLNHLTGFFRAKGIGPDEARDLAQDTVLRTLQHLKRHGRTQEDLGPLTRTIARNLLVERIRRARPTTVSLSDDIDAPDDAPDPSEIALQSERTEAVRAALRSLTPRHRKVIELWMQGQGPADIARELGIKRNAADAILHRARRTLAARLGPRSMWGGVGLLWFRFKATVRHGADVATTWVPGATNLAPAGVSLATVGLAAVLTMSAPSTEARTAEPAPVVAPVASARPAPGDHAPLPVEKSKAARAPSEGEEEGQEPKHEVGTRTDVTNPIDGEPDDVGFGLSYDPDRNGRGPVDDLIDPLLDSSCAGSCGKGN